MINALLAIFKRYEVFIAVGLSIVVIAAAISIGGSLQNYFTNRKLTKLQDQITAAEQTATKLQGVVDEKQKTIDSLNEALNESNKQVTDTGKQTDSVRTAYVTVRNSNPSVSLSDAALEQSVSTKLHELYSSPAGNSGTSK
jgi:uncharacterized protein HemX